MNYFRGASANERSAGGSSSRKGKKSNSDKPKQPQRGLGVAQLEKIRLHSQLGFHPQVCLISLNLTHLVNFHRRLLIKLMS